MDEVNQILKMKIYRKEASGKWFKTLRRCYLNEKADLRLEIDNYE
jgi:hypothetical protein